MIAADTTSPAQTDSPDARRYNRIRRWLGIADFVVGFGLLIVLLLTGLTGSLRDLAYRGGSQNYTFALILYVTMLTLLAKLLGMGLDYYGFRLEHKFHLSNQKFG